MSKTQVIASFLVGAAVGGALGILLAPDKGSETRRKIAEKGHELGDAVNEFGDTVKGKFNDAVDGLKENFNRARSSMS